MKNILIIAKYELKRIMRDRRSILIILSQPIVIAIVVGFLAYNAPKNIKTGLVIRNNNIYSQEIAEKLKANDRFLITEEKEMDENKIKSGKLSAFLDINIDSKNSTNNKITIYSSPTGRANKFYIQQTVTEILKSINPQLSAVNSSIEIENIDATPFNLKYLDYLTSASMVLLILLSVLNLSAISITTERFSGTFERLSVTPYSKLQIILGKTFVLFIVGIVVFLFGISSLYFIFSISLGNLWLVFLIHSIVALMAVSLGLLISTITYTVTESVQLAMYTFFIAVLTSGIFSPIETSYKYSPYFIKALPFYWAVDASRRVNMLDANFNQVSTNIYILIGFLLLFFVLSILLLKRQAK